MRTVRTDARLRLVAVFVVVVAGLVAAQLLLRGNSPRSADARAPAERGPQPIAWEDLTAAPVSLPTWPEGITCAHDAVQLDEPTNRPTKDTVVLVATDEGDVTGDGAKETIAIVHCVGTRGPGAMQAVAFTRDDAGAIVPLGQVTCDQRRMLLGVEVQPNGAVQVDAVSADGHEEWLTFRWSGDYFRPVV